MSLEETFISVRDEKLLSNESWEPQNGESVSEPSLWVTGIVIAVVYTLIITVGLIGNITLIRTLCTVKSMRNVPNLFMSSLAFGDVLLLVTCAPVDASRYLTDKWLFGRVGCKLIPFIQLMSVGVSVFTLTALAADRYKAIVKPMDMPTSHATAKVSVRACAIWILSMVLAVPEAIFSDLHTFQITQTNESFRTCAPYPLEGDLHPKIHSMASFLIFYVIPLLIISVYYFFIARSLTQSVMNMSVEGNVPVRQMESRKRLAKTVLVLTGLFALCWLPSHAIYLYRSFHYSQVDTSTIHFTASVAARILAFTNSCVNPFALYMLSKSFQKQFDKQLCCCYPHCSLRAQSTVRSNTRGSSLKSTHDHTLASFSPTSGDHICLEGCV